MGFEKVLGAVKMIKDQIQYRSQSFLNLARGYFSHDGNLLLLVDAHFFLNYFCLCHSFLFWIHNEPGMDGSCGLCSCCCLGFVLCDLRASSIGVGGMRPFSNMWYFYMVFREEFLCGIS